MPKIDKTDLDNISLIKKELKLKNITNIKIKKGDYEIGLSSSDGSPPITKMLSKSNEPNIDNEDEKPQSNIKNKIPNKMININ